LEKKLTAISVHQRLERREGVICRDEKSGAILERLDFIVLYVVALGRIEVLDAETVAGGVMLRIANEEGSLRRGAAQQEFFCFAAARFAEEPTKNGKMLNNQVISFRQGVAFLF
jgi:hypothetical protein